MDRNSANPVQRNKVPRKRSTHSTHMDRPRGSRVAEISQTEITKVEHQQEKCKPKVRASEQMNKAKEKKVVGNEVRTQVCSRSDVRLVAHVQGICVAGLQDEDDEHVDGGEDAGLRERSLRVVVPELVGVWA